MVSGRRVVPAQLVADLPGQDGRLVAVGHAGEGVDPVHEHEGVVLPPLLHLRVAEEGVPIDRATVELGGPGRIGGQAAVLAPVVDQWHHQADAAAPRLPDRLVEPPQPFFAKSLGRAAPDRGAVLRVVEAPDARHRQRQADQIVEHLARGRQRQRILILLRIGQQLLQVVEVGAGRAKGGGAVEQQRAVRAAQEPRDGRQRRATGVDDLVGAQLVGRGGGRLDGAAAGAGTQRERDGAPDFSRPPPAGRARPQSSFPRKIVAATVK